MWKTSFLTFKVARLIPDIKSYTWPELLERKHSTLKFPASVKQQHKTVWQRHGEVSPDLFTSCVMFFIPVSVLTGWSSLAAGVSSATLRARQVCLLLLLLLCYLDCRLFLPRHRKDRPGSDLCAISTPHGCFRYMCCALSAYRTESTRTQRGRARHVSSNPILSLPTLPHPPSSQLCSTFNTCKVKWRHYILGDNCHRQHSSAQTHIHRHTHTQE